MFDKVVKKLNNIDMSLIALEAFKDNKEIAFDMNTEEQLFGQGVDSFGRSLGDYAPLTVILRSEAGLPVDRITLKVTGDFYDGWEGDFNSWPVMFTSSDPKTGELLFMFGSDIFGLTDQNLKKLIDEQILESINDKFKSRLSKIFKDL